MGCIKGYFDYQTEHSLIGWIANLDDPSKLEDVVCISELGETLTFQPFLPRQDVCTAFNMLGRFGFAIPLSALGGFDGTTVRLSDRRGKVLNQAEAIPFVAREPAEPKPTWIVLHIQKTAGTSLRSALSQAVMPGEAVFIYGDGFLGLTPLELAALPLSQRNVLRLVLGHTYHGIGELLPGPSEYVTFLREPLARIRSHYLHHLGLAPQVKVNETMMDLEVVVSDGLTDEFDNLMVRMVAGLRTDLVPLGQIGEEHVELAIRMIRSGYRFVGLVERMQTHFRTLCKIMSIEPPVLRTENTCRVQNVEEAATAIDWKRVMHRNRFDAMLYRRIKAAKLAGRDLQAMRDEAALGAIATA